MSISKPFVEILIPTYQRARSAIRAIQSVLDANCDDVRVLCQSNGFEPELSAFSAENPKWTYQYFEQNQGAVVNFRELIRSSTAEYVIFMSDEDRINGSCIKNLVDHLRSHKPDFTFCSIDDDHGRTYFSIKGLQINHLTPAQVALLFPIHPTYLSGYCYRRAAITDELLDACFDDNPANAYPHLLLRTALIPGGKVSVFNQTLIIKGEEAKMGGDSHGHLSSKENAGIRPSLNPRLYGVKARTRQFVYLLKRLMNSMTFLSGFSRAYVLFYLLAAWSRMTNTANAVTGETFSFGSYADARQEVRDLGQPLTFVETTFLRLITLRPAMLRNILIQTLWMAAKGGRLALLLGNFGITRVMRFLKTRHG